MKTKETATKPTTKTAKPAEVGDFRRIGEDFYVTVDKTDFQSSGKLNEPCATELKADLDARVAAVLKAIKQL